MRLEATRKALRYRLKSGQEFLLKPGCPVDIPDEAAKSLLNKAGAQVRVVEDSIRAGQIAEWDSPLFGLVAGVVLEVLPHGVRVLHPLTEIECVIPASWLCKELR